MKKLMTLGLIMIFATMIMAENIYFLPENYNEMMPSRSRAGLRNNLPARLNALLEELKATDQNIKDNFDNLGSVIHKSWYLNAEFEKDRNIMLTVYREMLESLSNINDRLQGLEVELFNPDELGFGDMYSTLEATTKNLYGSYNGMEKGKSGLRKAKDLFGKAKVDYSKFTTMLSRAIDTVSGAVPYTPEPEPVVNEPAEPFQEPQPTINYNDIRVHVEDSKINPSGLDVINSNSYEGKLVVKKSKERMHEMSSTDRLMYKQALKGQDGFSYVIVKHAENEYTVYWWHLGDDIEDIFETIEDIFN